MKKYLAALLVLLLLPAGCARTETEPSPTPEALPVLSEAPQEETPTVPAGVYQALRCSDGEQEYWCHEDRLVLAEDGEGTLVFEGEEYALQWELSDEGFFFTDADGDEFAGSYEDGMIEGVLGGRYEFLFAYEAEPIAPRQTPEAEIVDLCGGEFAPVSADLGEYEVCLAGAELFWDIHGEAALRIYYDFTNRSDRTVSAAEILWLQAEQDGVELAATVDNSGEYVPEQDNDRLALRPGAGLRCVAEYRCDYYGGPVTLYIEPWQGGAGLAVRLSVTELPGRPAEDFVLSPEQPLGTDLPSEGRYEKYYDIAITGAEVVQEWYGGRTLRVHFDFTNLSGEEAAFYLTARYRAFQDGVELEPGWAVWGVTEDGYVHHKAQSGQTMSCTVVWALRSDSPAEVELYGRDYEAEAVLARVFETAEPAA